MQLWHWRKRGNKFSFPLIFICGNNMIATVKIKNICYLLFLFITFPFCFIPKYFCSNKTLLKKKLKKNFMAPFYGWGSTGSRLQPLQGGSLLFTAKFPEIPGTHFINLGRMRGWVDLGATHCFWTPDPWIGNPAP